MSISLQDPRIDWAFLKSYRFDQEVFEKLYQEDRLDARKHTVHPENIAIWVLSVN